MIKKRLSVLVVFVMLLTNFTFLSSGVSYADAPQKDKYELTSDILANIMDIDDLLSEYGLSFKMLTELPDRDLEYYEAFLNRVIETTSNPQLKVDLIYATSSPRYYPTNNDEREPLPGPSQKSKTSSDRWVYATQMAIQNKKNDPEVTDLTKETVYMYMSHYIDIPTGIIEKGIDKSISNDKYFSAWITREDRRVYDRFIHDMKLSDIVYGIADASCNIVEAYLIIKGILNLPETLEESRNNVGEFIQKTVKNYQGISNGLVDDYFLISSIIEGENNPVIAADNVKNSLIRKYDEKTGEAINAFFTDLFVLSAKKNLGRLKDLKLVKSFEQLKELSKEITKEIGEEFGDATNIDIARILIYYSAYSYNKYKWTVMVSSLRGRIPSRMYKYWGLYY